jgi:hypothetical protein
MIHDTHLGSHHAGGQIHVYGISRLETLIHKVPATYCCSFLSQMVSRGDLALGVARLLTATHQSGFRNTIIVGVSTFAFLKVHLL